MEDFSKLIKDFNDSQKRIKADLEKMHDEIQKETERIRSELFTDPDLNRELGIVLK